MQLIIHCSGFLKMSRPVLYYFKINLFCMYLIGGTSPYYILTGLLETNLTHTKVDGRTHLPFSDRNELLKTGESLKYYV